MKLWIASSSFLLLILAVVTVEGMRKQGVAVKGKLLCGTHPVEKNTTKVRIVDIDTGEFVK